MGTVVSGVLMTQTKNAAASQLQPVIACENTGAVPWNLLVREAQNPSFNRISDL